MLTPNRGNRAENKQQQSFSDLILCFIGPCEVNKVQSQTGESDPGNGGPITALVVSVRLRCLDGELKNIGCARRATERGPGDGEGPRRRRGAPETERGSPSLHTALYRVRVG